ncbi:uncharacterized protein PAC_07741 [Phialocephala subalpina]|uniref:Uncharacterized protein n=1 Tax=Phialocephala subalpina TaxID=576137 RepID=A0A1L7WYK3_9HELO|nr:uncharacterized protein PAC_07741 [Phialocephala subalpina]
MKDAPWKNEPFLALLARCSASATTVEISMAQRYCLVGQYCVGLNCCPNGLLPSCCGTGFNCPANVSDYYTTTSTTPPSGTTSLPVAITNSAKVSTTSAKPSTSLAPVAPTSVSTSAPATLKSTSSVVVGVGTSRTSALTGTSSSSTGAATVVPASGAQEKKMMMGSEGVAVAVLGVVGLVVGLM